MDEFDAYAPPRADTEIGAPRKKSKKKKAASSGIAEAIARLNEHLADAEAVARDRQEAGGMFRRPTIVFSVLTIILVATAATLVMITGRSVVDPVTMGLTFLAAVFVTITAILIVVDVRFLPRDKPASPEETLKHFFRAISMGRLGYAWAALCPTAREQTVETPVLGQIPVRLSAFTLQRTENLKDYAQTFARPGDGQMRTMQIKRATLLSEDGDVAVVEVTALFQAWPQWAQILCVIAFVFVRLLGLVFFLVLFFLLRKTHDVVFRKTLIRGSNGIWYVYSGDLLEGAAPQSF